MVPTFGMFDFVPVRVAELKADEAERAAFLAEVTVFSTEFGATDRSESEARFEDNLRAAMMYRF